MTKEELKQLTYIDKDIDRLRERIEQLESEVEKVTQRLRVAPAATSQDDYLKEILIDLKDKMTAKIQDMAAQKMIIEDYLLGIDDSLLRMILSYRYVDMLSWYDVALKVGGGNTTESVRKISDRYFEKEKDR